MLLDAADLAFLLSSRRAVLATSRPDGRPRLVPVCFVALVIGGATVIFSPLDEKPKRSADPHDLGRVRDVLERPAVSLLVDRWDEDWRRLAWLRLDGTARLLEPGHPMHDEAVAALRRRYEQYARHDLEARPLLAIEPAAAARWGETG